MREKFKNFLHTIQHKADCLVYNTAYCLSPVARFFLVLIIGGAMMAFSIYFVGSPIYNLGKRSAEIELMQLQQTANQELKQDSINILNFENYEYE
jgi:hypothetical protein